MPKAGKDASITVSQQIHASSAYYLILRLLHKFSHVLHTVLFLRPHISVDGSPSAKFTR